MGRTHSDGNSAGHKYNMMPIKRHQSVEITSKRVKQCNLLRKKIKHHEKVQPNENTQQLVTQHTLMHDEMKCTKRKRKKKSTKEKQKLDTKKDCALDVYFKSIDILDEKSSDVDIFEESFCKPSLLNQSISNLSDGLTTFDSSAKQKQQPSEAAGSSFAGNGMPNPLTKKDRRVTFRSLSNEKKIIIMKHPTSLYFQGQLNVKVVAGSLEVFGCLLNSDMPRSMELHSPGGSSLMCLATAQSQIVIDRSTAKDKLTSLGMDSHLAESIASKLKINDCLVMVEKSRSEFTSYLGSHCSIYLYPRVLNDTRPFFEEETILGCQFEMDNSNSAKVFTKLPEWDELADTIVAAAHNSTGSSQSRIMICGGKAVGKSTFLRFLINKALSTFDEVLCLDFDPGQSEFTVPGCVSVVRVRDPLVGPNFTHMLQPERMVYVGDVDISKCPDRYMKCTQHILDYCKAQKEFKNMIWFINTMGFSKGLGVDLATALIHMTVPTRLVQIESRSANRNFPELLTSTYATNSDSRWCRSVKTKSTELDYPHHVLQSAAERKMKGVDADWGMQPKTARDIMVLSYISQMLKPPRFSLTDILPVKNAFAQISLSVCHQTLSYAQYLSTMNANLVALCTADVTDALHPSDPMMPTILARPPIAPCVGFGIVRGIDMAARNLYIITPVSSEDLKAVNCLLLGAVMLPACIYTKPSSGLGHIPYVAMGPGQATSKGIGRRFFQPLKQQPQPSLL